MLNETTVWVADTVINDHIKKVNLINIFDQLATHDEDFNGGNGDEYLWNSAKEKGFETNSDYLTDEVLKDITDDEEIAQDKVAKLIDEYLSKWTGNDDYYSGVDFDFIIRNNVLFVAVAVAKEN